MLVTLSGCVHSLAGTGASVVSPSRRSAWLAGVAVRDDLNVPRNYQYFVGTEAILATQAATRNAPNDRATGQGQAAEHFGINAGWQRAPQASETVGWRIGSRLGVWHGALGDASSRWAVNLGADVAPLIRIGTTLPPWEADETISENLLLIPSLFVDPLVARLGASEQSHYAFSYGVMLSIGVSLSSTLVP